MPESLNADDLYERLGVPRTATEGDIKRAYRTLVRKYPPERAPEQFKRIREAYEAIGNAESRASYDRTAVGGAAALIARANAEMQEKRYAAAEQSLKRALIEDPGLSYARNLLGLCFLYQERAEDAIAQYSRLLREPHPADVWYLNAAHAFRLGKRYKDAELAFAEAVKRPSADTAERYVAWADLYLEQNQPGKALALLEQAVKADGKESFDDLPLLYKRLEIYLREQQANGIAATIRRIRDVCAEDAQKVFAAWKLALLAWQLLLVKRFGDARRISAAARELEPEDTDYDGLYEVADSLERNSLKRAMRAVRSHIAFAKDGSLAKLGPHVQRYCEEHAAYEGMTAIDAAPELRTINGFGTRIYGNRGFDARTSSYVATLYFCALFIPIVPLACYRVKSTGNGWLFLGKVPLGRGEKIHYAVVGSIALVWLAASLVSGGGTSQTAQALSEAPRQFVPPYTAVQPQAATPLITPRKEPERSVLLYKGTVTNDGLPDSPGTLAIRVDSIADTTTGSLEIGEPLGGSGNAYVITKPESLVVVSGNLGGDTILWLGRRDGADVQGRYRILTGVFKDQGGVWRVRRPRDAKKHRR